MSVVGSETGMDARRVDADSSGAREGTARLSVRPLRGVELRLSEQRAGNSSDHLVRSPLRIRAEIVLPAVLDPSLEHRHQFQYDHAFEFP